MKFDIKYYNYIAQETQTIYVEAENEMEAIVIGYLKSCNRNMAFDPEDYSVSIHYDPDYITKEDVLKKVTEEFNCLYKKCEYNLLNIN